MIGSSGFCIKIQPKTTAYELGQLVRGYTLISQLQMMRGFLDIVFFEFFIQFSQCCLILRNRSRNFYVKLRPHFVPALATESIVSNRRSSIVPFLPPVKVSSPGKLWGGLSSPGRLLEGPVRPKVFCVFLCVPPWGSCQGVGGKL